MRGEGGRITLLYEDPDYDAHLAKWQKGLDNDFGRSLHAGETLALAADDGVWMIHIVRVSGRVQSNAELTVEVWKVGDDRKPLTTVLHYGDELHAGPHFVYWLPVHGEIVIAFESPFDGEIAYELGVVDDPDRVRVFRHRFAAGRVIDLPRETTELLMQKSKTKQGRLEAETEHE